MKTLNAAFTTAFPTGTLALAGVGSSYNSG
jgi:hypothetical protein